MMQSSSRVIGRKYQDGVRRLFKDGVCDEGISKDLGISENYVKKIRHSLGLVRQRGQKKMVLTKEQDDYIKDNYRNKTYNEMSADLGISVSKVTERMRDFGLTNTHGSKNWDDVDDELILDLVIELSEKLEKKPSQVLNRARYLLDREGKKELLTHN